MPRVPRSISAEFKYRGPYQIPRKQIKDPAIPDRYSRAARLVAALAELRMEDVGEKQRVARARKMYSGCVDCHYRTHPEALQFDHLPGFTKLGNISQWQGSLESMIEEMDKCQVVCANCHALRTACRRRDLKVLDTTFSI